MQSKQKAGSRKGDKSDNLKLERLLTKCEVNNENAQQANPGILDENLIDEEELIIQKIEEIENQYREILHAKRNNGQTTLIPPNGSVPLKQDLSEIKEDMREHFLVTENSSVKVKK